MRFEFATATRILFGGGVLNEIGALAAGMGRRALVVVGGSAERAQPLVDLLAQKGITAALFGVSEEPTVALARQGVETVRREECDFVISFGGGSATDTGKAIAALTTNGGDPLDYLEVIGAGKPISVPPLPFIAIPTTAGTGAEVTRNAVLASPEHSVKVSLRSPLMLPKLALVDPQLTHSVPPDVTASTGMDALTQVLEPYVTDKATPLTDGFCREGLTRAARSLERAYTNGDDAVAREDMAMTSLLSGLALANAALGAVHGFAAPLCGMYPIPHGVACARVLPSATDVNVRALRQRQPDHRALSRYDEAARIFTGRADATAADGVGWIERLCEQLNIPRLSRYGVTRAAFPEIVAKARNASSMKGNPTALTDDELTEILERAL